MINPKKLCMGCMNEKNGSGICPVCGYNPSDESTPNALTPGTIILKKYLVGKVIDFNGEGFTYIGYDLADDAVLRIREFFPAGLCERSINNEVKVIAGSELTFNSATINFLELSKTLYRHRNLPSILTITDILEANGTAYSVAKDSPSITLREFLLRNGGTLSWEQARPLFVPMIASLKELHSAGILHRGLSPDTILVGKDGKMRMVGFCTADSRIAGKSLTAQLFPGFAAIEQYGSIGKLGEWTDVYGFAAVLYRTLVGGPPPEATVRLERDDLSIPAKIADELPEEIIDALCRALQLLPEDRIGNTMADMDELRDALVSAKTVKKPGRVQKNTEPKKAPKTKTTKKDKKQNREKGKKNTSVIILSIICALLLISSVALGYLYFTKQPTEPTTVPSSSSIEQSSSEAVSSKDPTKAYVTVDDFSGKSYSEITSGVSADGTAYSNIFKFKIVAKKYDEEIEENLVCEQNPKAGEEVAVGTEIELTVSLGKDDNIMVPSIIGQTESDAIIELMRAGFKYENIYVEQRLTGSASPGTVIEMSPAVGIRASIESKLTLYIEAEPETNDETYTVE